MLRRALLLACLALLAVPGIASAGLFGVEGTTIVYTPENGNGVDQITGFETADSYRFTRFGSTGLGANPGCALSPSGDTVDCPKTGITRVILNLGGGDDVATISPSITIPVEFNGEGGRDGLFGGGGIDTFEGGDGVDNIVSRDGRPGEDVDCGGGTDTAISDDGDVRRSCEEVEGDADGDGVRAPADCNDANPLIHPGVTDIPENGVDEDCNRVDAVISDRDGDGTPAPQDCNDADASIEPGIVEVVGNEVDENCDGIAEPLRALSGTVSGAWARVGSRTRNLSLVAKGFPAGTVIQVRCTGSSCRRRSATRRVRTRRRPVNLHGILGSRLYRSGTRIELSFTREARVGRVLRYQMRAGKSPSVDFLCRRPGADAGPC